MTDNDEPRTVPPLLLSLGQDADRLTEAKAALAANIISARREGHTWREISAAVGMTEHGVAKLHARTVAAS